VDQLQRRGLASVPCGDAGGVQQLAALFDVLPVRQMFEGSPESQYTVEGPQGEATFAVASSAVSDRMRWLWACDEQTLALFDGVARQSVETLAAVDGRPMMLYSACFVVVRGEFLKHDETSRHVDWGHAKLPEGSAFTCLGPLTAFPSSVGGLHYWPWDDAKAYGKVTSLNMNMPFVQHIHKYEPGYFAALDGRLFHRTEPFEYRRDAAELELCDAFEAAGHVRVLISLSIASSEERLARYARKILHCMTPDAALVRQSHSIYVHSDSECGTSESDSECEETLGFLSLRSVFQTGKWTGHHRTESEAWSDALEFSLDLRFDVRKAMVFNEGVDIGSLFLQDGVWHTRLSLELGAGRANIVGQFVRSSASVCLQGLHKTGSESAYVVIFPPRPWSIPWARWKQFPLPFERIGLPPETGIFTISIRRADDDSEPAHTILGVAASWNRCCGDLHESRSVEGPLVELGASPTGEELACLRPGCVVVAPDAVQRRGTLDRVLASMASAGASLMLVIAGGRANIPRGMRGPDDEAPPGVVPGFTMTASSVGAGSSGGGGAGGGGGLRPIAEALAGRRVVVSVEPRAQELDESRSLAPLEALQASWSRWLETDMMQFGGMGC